MRKIKNRKKSKLKIAKKRKAKTRNTKIPQTCAAARVNIK